MTRPAYCMIGGELFVNGSPPLPMTDEDYLAELERLTDEIAGANACEDFIAGLAAGRRACELKAAFDRVREWRALIARAKAA